MSAFEGRDCDYSRCVWTADGYRALIRGWVLHHALCQDIEGSTEKDIVGCLANNMYLEEQRYSSDDEGDIPRESQGAVHTSVRGLHVEAGFRVTGYAEQICDSL